MAEMAAVQASDAYKTALAAYRESQNQESLNKLNGLFEALKRPEAELAARFVAGAEKHAGSKRAVPYLEWLARNTREEGREAAATLAGQHVDDPVWQSFAPMASYLLEPNAASELAEKTPFDDVRVWLRYSMAEATKRDRTADESAKRAAQVELEKVVEAHPDSIPAMRIGAEAFKAENLAIGMTAPDIEGVDLDGVPFKLSDYRGKVVVTPGARSGTDRSAPRDRSRRGGVCAAGRRSTSSITRA